MDTILIICFATWLTMALLLTGSSPKGFEQETRERKRKNLGRRYN